MAGSLTDYSEIKILDHLLKGVVYAAPATVYLALSTTAINEDGTGITEPTGGYARKAVVFNAASNRTIANSSDFVFSTATGNWGTITNFAIYDALTGGNMLGYGTFSQTQPIASGNQASVKAGEITVTISAGGISTYYANKVLDFMFRNQALAVPNKFAGLSTVNPTDAGTPTEPSGNGYARVNVGNTWNSTANGLTDNTGDIVFPESTGLWGTVSHAFQGDAVSAGNVIIYSALQTSQDVTGAGVTVKVPAGNYDVRLN